MIDNYYQAMNQLKRVQRNGGNGRESNWKLCTHWFFASLARIIIFLLWLLLGLPHVTETNIAHTNIRSADEEVMQT